MTTLPQLVLVLVVDGLRPDSITPEDTPTLHRLRAEGVDFTEQPRRLPDRDAGERGDAGHGRPAGHARHRRQPDVRGGAWTRRARFGTDSHRRLLDVDRVTDGGLVLTPTLAERLHARGLALAAVSSGSTGSALLTNPRAPRGVGTLVNGAFEPGTSVAWPPEVSEEILARFGAAPPKQGADRYDAIVSWTQRVLREYVLPELAPAVVINWLTEPDHSQHVVGVGSPAAREALRHDDREIAQLLATLDGLGRLAPTAVVVVSDHGFTSNTAGIDVTRELIEAGLKAAPDSSDVVLASSGQAVGLHVAGHDPGRIARLARFVQSRDWGGVVFTAGRGPGDPARRGRGHLLARG